METLVKNNFNWENIIQNVAVNYVKYLFKIHTHKKLDQLSNDSIQAYVKTKENIIHKLVTEYESDLNKLALTDAKLKLSNAFENTVSSEIYSFLGIGYKADFRTQVVKLKHGKLKYVDEIENYDFSSDKFEINRLIDLKTIITKASKKSSLLVFNTIDINLYKILAKEPHLMKQLHWRTFEKLLANILESFNYEIELCQGTKDGGVDIIAIKPRDIFGQHRYLVQAKRYERKVQIEPVRSLLFNHDHYGATKSCLVTTSTFTSGAQKLANLYKWKLDLKDYNGIKEWLLMASIKKGII